LKIKQYKFLKRIEQKIIEAHKVIKRRDKIVLSYVLLLFSKNLTTNPYKYLNQISYNFGYSVDWEYNDANLKLHLKYDLLPTLGGVDNFISDIYLDNTMIKVKFIEETYSELITAWEIEI